MDLFNIIGSYAMAMLGWFVLVIVISFIYEILRKGKEINYLPIRFKWGYYDFGASFFIEIHLDWINFHKGLLIRKLPRYLHKYSKFMKMIRGKKWR